MLRRHVHTGAGRGVKAKLARLDVDGVAHRRDERRAPQLAHRQAEQQMMHRRVAADRDVDDVGRRGADRAA